MRRRSKPDKSSWPELSKTASQSKKLVTSGKKRKMVLTMKSARYTRRSTREMRRIFQYFLSGLAGAGSVSAGMATALSNELRVGFMLGTPLLEHAGNHLVQRRVLHAHVHHGVAIQDHGQHLGH